MKTWMGVIGGNGRVMVLFSHHSFKLCSSFGQRADGTKNKKSGFSFFA